MNNQNIVTIVEYEELLEKLLPMRIFHKRIIGILLYHWFLAGVFDAEQQLAQLKDEEFFLYLLPGLTIVILGVMIILYDRIGRYKINVVVGGLIMCSVILRVITLEIDSRRGFVVGELLIGCLPRAMCGNLLFLILEYFPGRYYSRLLISSLIAESLGRIFVAILSNFISISIQAYLLVPLAFLLMISVFWYQESPRYFIDHDLLTAERLLMRIAHTNQQEGEEVLGMLQRQFWSKAHLQKYNMLTLYKYSSLSFQTYISSLCFLFTGIMIRCPDFIMHIKKRIPLQYEDSVEMLWINCCGLCALMICYVVMLFVRRKYSCLGLSSVLVLIGVLLMVLDRNELDYEIVYSMALLGLNEFFETAYLGFLLVQCVEYYPHTVRTLAGLALLAMFELGKLVFVVHVKVVKDRAVLLELVLVCSVLVFLHSFPIYETYQKQLNYEVKEIEEKFSEDY